MASPVSSVICDASVYLDDATARSRMSFKLRKGGEDVAAYLASVAE
jgi:cytochrome c